MDVLPNETLTHILRYMSTRETIDSMESCRLVCWQWHDIATSVRPRRRWCWKLTNTAAKNKHADLLCWLVQHGCTLMYDAVKYAISTNRLDIIQYMPRFYLGELSSYAAKYCTPAVVKYFIDEFCADGDLADLYARACKHDNTPVMDMLMRDHASEVGHLRNRDHRVCNANKGHGTWVTDSGKQSVGWSAGRFAMVRPHKHLVHGTPIVSAFNDAITPHGLAVMMTIDDSFERYWPLAATITIHAHQHELSMQQVLGRCLRMVSHEDSMIMSHGRAVEHNALQQFNETAQRDAQEQLRQFTRAGSANVQQPPRTGRARQKRREFTVGKQCARRAPGLRRR